MNITVKRPDKEDAANLAPTVAVFFAWFFLTDRSMRRSATMLIPAAVGVAAWILAKGLRYVPR